MSVADKNDPAAEKRMENGAVLAVGNHAAGFQEVKFQLLKTMLNLR